MPTIRSLTAIRAAIPLRQTIRHASHERTANAALLIRCELDDGSVGWGEGLPRPYVTGETIETAWGHTDRLGGLIGERADSLEAAAALTDAVTFEPPAGDPRGCLGNSVRCAAELALLDAVGRATGRPVMDLVQPLAVDPDFRPQPVCYAAVLPQAGTWRRATYRAVRFRLFGIDQVKVKLGVDGFDDERTLRLYRRWLGRRIHSADANEGWSPDRLDAKLALLRRHRVRFCEQPVPHAEAAALGGRAVSQAAHDAGAPAIMLDESFCSLADAETALDRGWANAFNVRLSKCGGIVRSMRLVRWLLERSTDERPIFVQLGCQVGETAILSAAGRAVAAWERSFEAVEGSYDRFLVAEPLSEEDITFGRGGLAPPLHGPGLGITIDDDAIARVTRDRKLIA